MTHGRFQYQDLADLKEDVKRRNLEIHFSEDTSIFNTPLKLGNKTLPNRLGIHPMEGCDGLANGTPSDLTRKRYHEFARSNAGLIWWEATAIKPEVRANPRQLMLTEENKEEWIKLIGQVKEIQKEKNEVESMHLLQITHSGRYSRPGKHFPQRLYEFPELDKAYGQKSDEGTILTDEQLKALPKAYETVVQRAKEVGFDGVDIKSCHRYLLSESLSAFTRENSKYGGESFENRSRLLKSIITPLLNKYQTPDFLVSLRLNVYDGIPYPFGFGAKKDDKHWPPRWDLREPIRLLTELNDAGVTLANISIGNPYFNAFISRPFNMAPPDLPLPEEHPLEGVLRFLKITRKIKAHCPPELKIISTGYSWLQHLAGYVGAAELQSKNTDIVGFGRMAFANPQFARQILHDGEITKAKSCITCSKCTEMMRLNTVTGCLIRDARTYHKYYKKAKKANLRQ